MIEESIIKSNFIGRDGFRWWIGQVAPEEAQGDQLNQIGDAWGNRVKVRIMGYHPQNTVELKVPLKVDAEIGPSWGEIKKK